MASLDPTEPPLSPEAFAAATGVSRETLERLKAYDAVFQDWASRHNLVARSTLEDRWRRHFLDSAQLFPHLPDGARTLVDLGSGAGFPGLVLAAMGAERSLAATLVESTAKKCAFLAAAAEAMGLGNVSVRPERIESMAISPPDVITARALAPLGKLLAYAHALKGENTVCLFLKGQDVASELTEAAKYWHMEAIRTPSVTHPGASIVTIRTFAPKRVRP